MESTEPIAKLAATSAELPTFSSLFGRVFSYPVALAAALATLTILTLTDRLADPDLWWHLKVGETVWNTHTVPVVDLFSFTAPGQPSPPHEWLSELTMFTAYKLMGYSGLMLWLSCFASIAFLLVYLLGWEMTGNWLVGLRGGIVAWFFGTTGLSTRPQVIGYGFLAGELLILELARNRNPRWLWALPPMFALWVNCHASYYLGLGVLGIYFVSSVASFGDGLFRSELTSRRLRRDYGLVLVLCTLALCINPMGPRLLLFPYHAMFQMKSSLNLISEFLPPDMREPRALAMLAVVIGVFAFCMFTRTKLSIRELLLLLIAAGLATQHTRMLFPFGILISPVLCRLGVPQRRNPGITAANMVMIAACLIAVLHFFPNAAELEHQVRKSSAVGAVDFVKNHHLAGPMLNDYGLGGYLVWALPEHKVFVDGRAEVYHSVGVVDAYRRWAYLEEDPKILLDKYKIGFCILAATSPMTKVLMYLGWRNVYSDDVAVVFTR